MQNEYKEISIIFYLIASIFHNVNIDEKSLLKADVNLLFSIAKKNSLSAILYSALEKTKFFENVNPIIIEEWKELKENAIRKNIMFNIELKQILAEFEKRQIWYMLLKGTILKSYYPKEYMREMADIDILYDKKHQREVKEIFKLRNYDVVSFAKETHDVYRKKPIYNFEMHAELFSQILYPELYSFFGNIQEKLISDIANIYEKNMCLEDLYIYVIAHAYKHYANAGIGFRYLIDIYVINNKFGEKLNRIYIYEKLKQIGIIDFERSSRNLANHLLDKVLLINILDLPVDEQTIFYRCYSSGIYGCLDNYLKINLKKYAFDGENLNARSKIKYYFDRMFPNKNWYKFHYPRAGKFIFLIPFLWVHRLVKMLLFKRKKIKYEIGYVNKTTSILD